ncbi:hypothetical protein DL96DRAFT_1828817 [Flagelloscypha sp. PMI_526]|nr:hypothetical protein DL96DRAFT_1828817 [Flagelloscypha sp. PMI_526]
MDESLRYILNHVFMPLRLPQASDLPGDDFTLEYELARSMYTSVQYLADEIARSATSLSSPLSPDQHLWKGVLKTLQSVVFFHQNEAFSAENLEEKLLSLEPGGTCFSLLIRAQNTVLILRVNEESVHFDAFTASLPNAVIHSTPGRIRQGFPEASVSFPLRHFKNEHLASQIASVLASFNVDEMDESAAHAVKSGSKMIECRDQASAHLITSFFLDVLSVLDGQRHAPQQIIKRIRDDVISSPGPDKVVPWRRSKLWILLRVVLQTTLGPATYKNLMVYYLSCLLERACHAGVENELLAQFRHKIAYRCDKLEKGHGVATVVAKKVQMVEDLAKRTMQAVWDDIRAQTDTLKPEVPWNPRGLKFQEDAKLMLTHSGPYLKNVLARPLTAPPRATFSPSERPRLIDLPSFADMLTHVRQCKAFSPTSPAIQLLELEDFENLMRTQLPQWIASHRSDEQAPVLLRHCINKYNDAAASAYGNPESQSIRILTVLDLWVALDRIVLSQIPLLSDYPCDLSPSLLQPLLLRRRIDLSRAISLAQYLHKRSRDTPSVFAPATSSSFSYAYFCSGNGMAMQELLAKITLSSQTDSAQKRQDVKDTNRSHNEMLSEAAQMEHIHSSSYQNGVWKEDKRGCKRCQKVGRAHSLKVSVWEYYLPSGDIEASNLVFELLAPIAFVAWRSATFTVLNDIFIAPKVPQENKKLLLVDYVTHRKVHSGPRNPGRLTLASTVEAQYQTHYGLRKKAPVKINNVLLNHGPQWRLYDTQKGQFVSVNALRAADAASICTHALPLDSLYAGLEFALSGTYHSVNKVLATQSNCSPNLTLQEWTSFGTVRSGPRLQWYNVLRELITRTISFNRTSVYLLLSQTIQQVGPIGHNGRVEWHEPIHSLDFCEQMLASLSRLYNSVKENWQEVGTMKCLVDITARLLSEPSLSSSIFEKLINFIRACRISVFQWLCTGIHARNTVEASFHKARLCEFAALTRQTYLPGGHFQSLFDSESDVEMFIFSLLVLHSYSTDIPSSLYVARDRSLNLALERATRRICSIHPSGVHRAILRMWPSYRSGPPLQFLPSPNGRWLAGRTQIRGDQVSQTVHLNILSGELLVDARPVGLLPVSITSSEVYKELLGNRALEVVPSDVVGCAYKTVEHVHGYQVGFALFYRTPLRLTSELQVLFAEVDDQVVIRALPPGTDSFADVAEYLPRGVFADDLPRTFVEDYAHWFQLSSKEVEFAPVETPWETSRRHWHLQYGPRRSVLYETANKDRSLVDPNSRTFRMFYERVKPLEEREWVWMLHRPSTSAHPISISLPRYRLSFLFSPKHDSLESQDFPGTIIDRNQSIDTLHGLANKLVLREKVNKAVAFAFPRIRRVLIPDGRIHRKQTSHHQTIIVDTDPKHAKRVAYHVYHIDKEFNTLVCQSSRLDSRLFKIYLHALTSHVLPDALTCMTGVEEALHQLQSAACMSFQRLTDADISRLRAIAALTPRRDYYPIHLKVMQNIHWSTLPSTSQLANFALRVEEILAYDRELAMFEATTLDNLPELNPPNDPLLHRARYSEYKIYTVQVLTASNLDISIPSDSLWYPPPPSDTQTHPAHIRAASIVFRRTLPLYHQSTPDLHSLLSSYKTLTSVPPDLNLIGYSRNWFQFSRSDMQSYWLGIWKTCSQFGHLDQARFRLLFSAASWAYLPGGTFSELLLNHLVLAFQSPFKDHGIASGNQVVFSFGSSPSPDHLRTAISRSVKPVSDTPNSFDPTHISLIIALTNHWEQHLSFESFVISSIPDVTINQRTFMSDLQEISAQCHLNRNFRQWSHFQESSLVGSGSHSVPLTAWSVIPIAFTPQPKASLVKYSSPLHSHSPPFACPLSNNTVPLQSQMPIRGTYNSNAADSLAIVLGDLSASSNRLHQRYAHDMGQSQSSLVQAILQSKSQPTTPSVPDLPEIEGRYTQEKQKFNQCMSTIVRALAPVTLAERLLEGCRRSNPPNLRLLLIFMTFRHWPSLSNNWKYTMVKLCQHFMHVQYLRRLFHHARLGWEDELNSELETGPPVLQIEHDFNARPVQLTVAREMCYPSIPGNVALQLNMGEGKSSVIVPFIACSLADGTKLARVVVLKPLSTEMFSTLVARVSGLSNRRVAYLPFSRQMLHHSQNIVQRLSCLHASCLTDGGILLSQPEHILSAKLLSVERILRFSSGDPGAKAQATDALALQHQLYETARDILDESDEELSTRYQLIYTWGKRGPVQGHPHRWSTLQQLLVICWKALIQDLPANNSFIVPIQQQAWAYPKVYIRSDDPEETLRFFLTGIIDDAILQNRIPSLNLVHLDPPQRRRVSSFVLDPEPSMSCLATFSTQSPFLQEVMLILRGFLSTGILVCAFLERRWKVDYGLDLSRSMLAVPFRANDTPSPRSDFGHVDLATLLTYLAYYYQGLTDDQLIYCFTRLLKHTNRIEHYAEWCSLIPTDEPHEHVQDLSGINLEDSDQFERSIAPFFRFNYLTINFYLSELVFPIAAKQFSHKLPTSGWDIAERRPNPTTGFSGTKDNHYLLPLSIQQVDPVGQSGTNAMVLQHILHPSNSIYETTHEYPTGKTIIDLVLRLKCEPRPRVLLDVGALILDMTNHDVAFYWLTENRDHRIEVALYFNDNDELTVIRRDGTTEPYRTSTYAQQAGKSIVYLDDAHTRGTDLKLPRTWKAAVTLGKKMTKDRLAQGCMRMRRLGEGQTLMFIAPKDIDFSIRRAVGKIQNPPTVRDIVYWSMLETCKDIERNAPGWAHQGRDYLARSQAFDSFTGLDLSTPKRLKKLRKAWLQPETKSLEALYHPTHSENAASGILSVKSIRERLEFLGLEQKVLAQNTDEEQEREVSHEVEVEREIERPQTFHYGHPRVHPDLCALVEHGLFDPDSPAFMLLSVYVGLHIASPQPPAFLKTRTFFNNRLYVSTDFATTAKQRPSAPVLENFPKDFMKPLQWIMTFYRSASGGRKQPVYLAVTPYEVNELLPAIRKSSFVQVHLYVPRMTPSQPYDSLRICSIPTSPPHPDRVPEMQLYLFAGQLYPSCYSEYLVLCQYLGVDTQKEMRAQSDGFILPKDRTGGKFTICPFASSPMLWFKELVGLRCKGQNFESSPIGKLLEGRVLEKAEFERLSVRS